MTAISNRLRQGFAALLAVFRPVDEAAVQAVLSADLYRLFERMTRSEQQHAIRVMKRLQADGHDQPDLLVDDLLVAALLHDVGKSRYGLNLFERSIVVLAGRLLPRRAAAWAQGEPHGWGRAFVIRARHPIWSAEDMDAAGASPLACELARRHQDPPLENPTNKKERLLALLQTADNLS